MGVIQEMTLEGRTALVCGASQGIGAAVAQALAELGARLIVLARDEAALRSRLESLPRPSSKVPRAVPTRPQPPPQPSQNHSVEPDIEGGGRPSHRMVVCDVLDRQLLRKKILQELEAVGGTIDVLVCNSGGPPGGAILEAQEDVFCRTWEQHVLTNHLLAQLLAPSMKKQGFGRIINVISTSVKIPIPSLGVSNTVRAAVASWAKTLANEVAASGITVNSVLPGYTKTARLESLMKAAAERQGKTLSELTADWRRLTPMGRFAEPEEVAAAVAFLATPAASYITGVALPVDGGRTGSI